MLSCVAFAAACFIQAPDYTADLKEFIEDIRLAGAYTHQDKIDFDALQKAYEPTFRDAKTKTDVLRALEDLIGELHDFHAGLGSNDDHSPRLVPTGADIYAAWHGDNAIIEEVRPNSIAQKAGVQYGDDILQINGKTAKVASEEWLHVRKTDPRAAEYGLNAALAGRWDSPRKLTVKRSGKTIELSFATAAQPSFDKALDVENLPGGILYLRPENSLGQYSLVTEFDHHRADILKAKRIVIDLRNTPSGGDSSVARAILGHFVRSRRAFQRHTFYEIDTNTIHDWVEYANPRYSQTPKAKVAILVDHWTGSMGEGIAIGFDATGAGTVIGTHMAGLRGAISGFELPVSKLRVQFPTEKIYHVDGTPREFWKPKILVQPKAGDPWMDAARRFFRG
ncbi:MAG: PDZ domain-containing protein [Armatimonadetes bacterium]|nr:PDZ domain-containing protein [Armatimonadota bacterium]